MSSPNPTLTPTATVTPLHMPIINPFTGRPLPPPPPPPCLSRARSPRRKRSVSQSSSSSSSSRSRSRSRKKKHSRKSRKHSRKSKRSSRKSSTRYRKSKKSRRRTRSRSNESRRRRSKSSIPTIGPPAVIRHILDPSTVQIPRRIGEGINPIFGREELKESIRRRMEIEREADRTSESLSVPASCSFSTPNQSVSLIPPGSRDDAKWLNLGNFYSPDTTRKSSRGRSSSRHSQSRSRNYRRSKSRQRRYTTRSNSNSTSGSESRSRQRDDRLSKIVANAIKPGACWCCLKVGHKWRDCRERMKTMKKKRSVNLVCEYCHRPGHLTEHCGEYIWKATRKAILGKNDDKLIELKKNLEPGEISSSSSSESEKTENISGSNNAVEVEQNDSVDGFSDGSCWDSEVERVDRKSILPIPNSQSRFEKVEELKPKRSKIPESGLWVHDKFEELEKQNKRKY